MVSGCWHFSRTIPNGPLFRRWFFPRPATGMTLRKPTCWEPVPIISSLQTLKYYAINWRSSMPWLTCEVPEVDSTGKQLPTSSQGKLGERFEQPCDEPGASMEHRPKRV